MLQRMLRADRGEPFDLSRLIGEAWPLLFVGVAYVILGLAGLELASLNPSVTSVWPPTGLAIAAVLLFGQRVVPVIFAAAFVVNQLTLPSASTSVVIASGNTLEAVLAGLLIGYWAEGVRAFASPTNVLKFFGICIIATALAATIGAGVLTLTGHAAREDLIPVWFTWWMGDLAGAIVVAPCLVLWAGSEPFTPDNLYRSLATYVGAAAIGLVCLAPFLPHTPIQDAASYLVIIPLLWAALNLGTRDTATVALILSVIAAWAANGLGNSEAVSIGHLDGHTVLLLAFMISITVPSLALSAEIDRRSAIAKTQEQHSLEARVLWKASNDVAAGGSLEDLLSECLEQICKVTNWQIGHVYVPDNPEEPTRLYPSSVWYFQSETFEPIARRTADVAMRRGQSLPGLVWATGKPKWISDISTMSNFPRKEILLGHGISAACGFPIYAEGKLQAVVEFFSSSRKLPDAHLLRTVMNIGEQLGRIFERQHAREQEVALQRVLDTLTTAIFFIDSAGSVVHMNDAAKQLVGANGPLTLDKGRLVLTDPRAAKEFDVAIQRVMEDGPAPNSEVQTISLPVGDTDRFSATLVPLTSSSLANICGIPPASAAMFVQEPVKNGPRAATMVAKVYGLTHSELRVLEKLSPSGSIKSLAADLGVSENTIKTHFQHIFQKTGTSNRTELIELLRSSTPPIRLV
jgi:integral membrane sensor domain MASE1/DNA-binding CsgD family transcriptional regulator/PAS domain-containing protein